jgi:nitric oxide reductase NorQ protein
MTVVPGSLADGPDSSSAASVPFYLPAADEVELFHVCVESRLPVMLVGPTGCGKTRLVEHMAARLGRTLTVVVGNDDTTTADLLGRYLVHGGDVEWRDGPVTTAARRGEVCYIDEVIEVRREAMAVLHPLADDRRRLHLDRLGESIEAADGFALVCSYNPDRAVGFRDLRPAFRQRFVTIAIDYLPADAEADVLVRETGVSEDAAERLVRIAAALRYGVGERGGDAPSTRLLVNAAYLIVRGVGEARAVEACVIQPLLHGRDRADGNALRELALAI